jgi:hypothetical protein
LLWRRRRGSGSIYRNAGWLRDSGGGDMRAASPAMKRGRRGQGEVAVIMAVLES